MTAENLDVFDLNLNSNAAIEASAGTGKTYTIGSLVIRYILGDMPDGDKFSSKYRQNRFLDIKNFLIVTFTKAAAADLKRKILERIVQTRELFELMMLSGNAECLDGTADEFVQRLAKKYLDEDGAPKSNLRDAIKLLKNAERDIDLSAISTIHSFCQKILKISAFESKLMFRFDFLDSVAQISKTKLCDALRKMFYESGDSLALKNKDLNAKLFNDLLGKNDSSVKKFLSLVNDLYTEQSGTVVPLSNDSLEPDYEDLKKQDAWKRLVEDTYAVLNSQELLGEYKGQDISEFDKKLDDLLLLTRPKEMKKKQEEWLAYSEKFGDESISDEDFIPNFKKPISARGFKLYYHVEKSKTDNIFGFINSRVRNLVSVAGIDKSFLENFDFRSILARIVGGLNLGSINASKWIFKLAAEVVNALKEWKSLNNLLSFDDLIIKLKDALDESKPNNKVSAALLKNRIRELYPVAFIDEFQDTDENQWSLFSSIYDDASKDDGCNIYIIGDPKQAIYRFRNADIYTYFDAKKSVSGERNLATNYRSTPKVVNSVNKLFMANPEHPGKSFGAEGDITFSEVGSVSKNDKSIIDSDGNILPPVSFFSTASNEDASIKISTKVKLAKACARQVKLFASRYFFESTQKPIRYGDCAVLVQSKSEAASVRKALNNLNIKSIYLSDDSNVYSSPQITSFMKKFMAAVINNADYASVKRLLLDPLNCMPLKDIDNVFGNAKLFSDFSTVLCECLGYWKKNNFVRALYAYAFSKDLWNGNDLFARLSIAEGGDRHVTDLCHLAECLQCEMRSSSSVFDLYQRFDDLVESASQNALDEESTKARLSSCGEYVKIITMHKSKGLEYPIVLMPFVLLGPSNKRDFSGLSTVVHETSAADSGEKKRKRYVMGTEKSRREEEVRKLSDEEDQNELTRLLYVAVTRAKFHNWYGICPPDSGYIADKSVMVSLFCHQFDCSLKNADNAAVIEQLKLIPTHFKTTVETTVNKQPQQKPSLALLAWNAYLDRLGRDNFHEFEFTNDELLTKSEYNTGKEHETSAVTEESYGVSEFKGNIDWDWGVTSFSKLIKLSSDNSANRQKQLQQTESEDPLKISDEPNADTEQQIEPDKEFSRFTFPRGPKPGDFLHNLMERMKFQPEEFCSENASAMSNQSDRISWYQNIGSDNGRSLLEALSKIAEESFFAGSKTLNKWIDPEKGLPVLGNWFSEVVNTPIPVSKDFDRKCVRLRDVNDFERLSEVKFSFSLGKLQAEEINELLMEVAAKNQWVNLSNNKEKNSLNFPQIQGYLTGFIDLLFRHNGKFYLVDYKSNILHKEYKDFCKSDAFSRENMENEIVEHRYDFQYAVYCVAIYRYLKSRHRGPEEFCFSKVFGGIAYLFLRGMNDVDENSLPKSSHETGLSDIDVPGVFDVRLPCGWGGKYDDGTEDAFIKRLAAIFEKSSASEGTQS